MELAQSLPVAAVCRMLDVPTSTYYYRSQKHGDEPLRTAIGEEAATWPKYGYRRITQELRRKQWRINEKKVRRLMREMNLQVKPTKRQWPTTDSRHNLPRYPNLIRGLEVARPDQVWAGDITYVRLRHEYVYLAVIMDLFTRAIRGWHLGRRLDHSLTLTALEKALLIGVPQIHHSDQGVQYAAVRYVEQLQEAGVQVSMSDIGHPTQNAHVERLIRTIKEEEVDLSEYASYPEALAQIGQFIEDVYSFKRIHSALGYLTPVEYEMQWQSIQAEAIVI